MCGSPRLTGEPGGNNNDSMPRRFTPPILILFTLLSSCMDGAKVSAALDEVPDTVSENLRQVSVSPTRRVVIESERVEVYSNKDFTIFSDAGFREFDSEGELLLEGNADRIEIEGNRDGSAEGTIRIYDVSEDSRLEAERLDWDDSERILTGHGVVHVETGDGLAVDGRGFIADMARETYRYTDGVEGTLEIDGE